MLLHTRNMSGIINDSMYAPFAKWATNPLNRGLVVTSSCLSIVGSLIIIVSFVSWKDIRTTSRSILLFLSIADLMTATSNALGVMIPFHSNIFTHRNNMCVAQAFFTTSFAITSFMWTLTLALYLYLAIVKNKQDLGKKLMPVYHIISWSLGPIINGIALSQSMLGYASDPFSGGWCWIYHDYLDDTPTRYVISGRELMWIFIDGKGIEITVYTTICVIYGIIKYKLHKELKERLHGPLEPQVLKAAKSADRKLIFVPVLLVFGRIFGLVRLFINLISVPQPTQRLATYEKVLLTLQGFGDSSQGFLNCILFCFLNPRVYSHLKEAFMYYVCCRWRTVDDDSEPSVDGESLNSEKEASFSVPEQNGATSKPLLTVGARTKRYGSLSRKFT